MDLFYDLIDINKFKLQCLDKWFLNFSDRLLVIEGRLC